MSLSENIKRLRLEKGMTQEELASKLGISAQAVSKWETTETYPDGALLVPLARELSVSLDELFDHKNVTMADLSERISELFDKTKMAEDFHLARDICWQVQRGMCRSIRGRYSEGEIDRLTLASYRLTDKGFTLISNGKEPFFSLFPEPQEGFGAFLDNMDDLQALFTALSSESTMRALLYLMRKKEGFTFEPRFLARECEIEDNERIPVLNDLCTLGAIRTFDVSINGEMQTLCTTLSAFRIVALFLVANTIPHSNGYCCQSHNRNKPLLPEASQDHQ